jgi:hypothetical protein
VKPAVFVKALLWSLAAGFLLWSLWGVGAGVGGAVGGALGVLAPMMRPMHFAGRNWRPTLVVLLGLLVAVLFLPWLFAVVTFAAVSLILANALPACLLSYLAAWVTSEFVVRFPTMRIAEMFVIAIALVWPFLPASGGNHVRPQWLSDPALEQGYRLTDALSWVGWLGAVFCLLILLLGEARGKAGRRVRRGLHYQTVLGGTVLLAIAVGAGWFVSKYLAPVEPARVAPPPPPVSFAGDPPPPPPPEPLPVAAVQLEGAYVPPSRLSAFFFRAPDANELLGEETGNVVEAKIYYLSEEVAPLALAGPAWIEDIRVPHTRFKRAQSFKTRLPAQSDFALSSVSDLIRVELVALQQPPQPTAPEISPILSEIDSVMKGELIAPEESRLAGLAASSRATRYWDETPSLQAVAIVDWLEQKGEFSAKADSPEEPAAFVKSGLKGGSKHFAKLAVALMQSRGIASRLAEGYIVTAEKDPTDRVIITDGHKDFWPEVQLVSGEWIPLPVRPKRVSDREEPPPREDAKDEIFASIQEEQPQLVVESASQPMRRGASSLSKVVISFLVGVAVIAGFLSRQLFLVPSRRVAAVDGSKQHRAALREVGQLSARLIRPRHFGETWRAYASSIGRDFPGAGSSLAHLLDQHAAADEGGRLSSSWSAIYRRTARQMLFARLTPRFKKPNALNPVPETAQ